MWFSRKTPEKPELLEDQIDQLWVAVYNHLPSKLQWIDMKQNFILVFMTLVLGLLGVLIVKG